MPARKAHRVAIPGSAGWLVGGAGWLVGSVGWLGGGVGWLGGGVVRGVFSGALPTFVFAAGAVIGIEHDDLSLEHHDDRRQHPTTTEGNGRPSAATNSPISLLGGPTTGRCGLLGGRFGRRYAGGVTWALALFTVRAVLDAPARNQIDTDVQVVADPLHDEIE